MRIGGPYDAKTIVFEHVDGRDVPRQPWPQMFYLSGAAWRPDMDAFVVRPLTLSGLIKGVGRNFVTMNYWRFMVTLRILGFMRTAEFERLSWRHFTWRVWEHQMWWRLRIVKFGKRLYHRVSP